MTNDVSNGTLSTNIEAHRSYITLFTGERAVLPLEGSKWNYLLFVDKHGKNNTKDTYGIQNNFLEADK